MITDSRERRPEGSLSRPASEADLLKTIQALKTRVTRLEKTAWLNARSYGSIFRR